MTELVPRLSETPADLVKGLLSARGAVTPEEQEAFLRPDAGSLGEPFLLEDMAHACELVNNAVTAGDLIAVYGDYDCDGVCATVILEETLGRLGARAEHYIPDRSREGYGLNEDAIR